MKICAVICEYNPFHSGHLYQLGEMKKRSGCDAVLCLMSGNFTQRGEIAVFGKYTRARHAVQNGADLVLELPTPFAVSPAELFARGAVHLLAAIPSVTHLAFGCESGEREDFLKAANATLREDKIFQTELRGRMKDGTSYVKARTEALLALNSDVDESLLTSPNNVLGVEYCRALLLERSAMEPLPIPRVGGGYADTDLREKFSSAIRAVLTSSDGKGKRALKTNLPPTVYEDARSFSPTSYETAAILALLKASAEEVAACPDCAEGIENRLHLLARTDPTYSSIVEKCVSRRYTRSRIKRILLQNFLGVRRKEVRAYAEASLYLRPLAVKKEKADELLAALAASPLPLVTRKSDLVRLRGDALACIRTDLAANALSDALRGIHTPDCETLLL